MVVKGIRPVPVVPPVERVQLSLSVEEALILRKIAGRHNTHSLETLGVSRPHEVALPHYEPVAVEAAMGLCLTLYDEIGAALAGERG